MWQVIEAQDHKGETVVDLEKTIHAQAGVIAVQIQSTEHRAIQIVIGFSR